MNTPRNPFQEAGYHSGMMDVAIQCMLRGRRGEGVPVHVAIADYHEVVTLDPADRAEISRLVDSPATLDPVRAVVVGIIRATGVRNRPIRSVSPPPRQ